MDSKYCKAKLVLAVFKGGVALLLGEVVYPGGVVYPSEALLAAIGVK